MARALKVLFFVFCMTQCTSGNSALKHLIDHLNYATKVYGQVYDRLGEDFAWLRKNKVAKWLVAESISTMRESCLMSCGYGKNYHKAVCSLKAGKIFPLIYGKLMIKDASKKDLCTKVDEDEDSFNKLCAKHCITNTHVAMLIVANEAQRMIDGKSPDGMSSEEGEESGNEQEMEESRLRLYQVDDDLEPLNGAALWREDANATAVPTWVHASLIASVVSMAIMGIVIYSLKKRLAATGCIEKPGVNAFVPMRTEHAENSEVIALVPCEEEQLE